MDTVEQKPSAAISPDQALAILGKGVISRASFYGAINRGEVPHLRLGKRILIPRAVFEKWLASATITAPAKQTPAA